MFDERLRITPTATRLAKTVVQPENGSEARLSLEGGFEDEGYFLALVRLFDQALVATMALAPQQRPPLLARLDKARLMTEAIGWGVKDAVEEIWLDHVMNE